MNIQKSKSYYKSVLKQEWEGMDEQSQWLQSRCDSQLEVIVGLAILGAYTMWGNYPGTLFAFSDHIHLGEAFCASPSSNGVSSAFLTAQHQDNSGLWDFCIYTGSENGDNFDSDNVKPRLLIDIDGYGIHKQRRELDSMKLSNASISAIRICEERFKDPWQIAEAILYSSVWDCCCAYCEDHEKPDCSYCCDSKNRVIFNNIND